MIEIEVISNVYKIKMEGHANYAEKGSDVVCAAASILFYTLAETVKRYQNIIFWRKPRIVIDESDGEIKALIQCIPKPEYKRNLDVIYQTILNGFELLAKGYPDNVNLKII